MDSFKVVFFSSSSFTIPILESIRLNSGRSLEKIFWEQYDQFLHNSKQIEPDLWLNRSYLEELIGNSQINFKRSLEILLVVTQPDNLNHGKKVENPVSRYANIQKLNVFKPLKINREYDEFKLLVPDLDLAVVASFGQIISQKILDLARFGFINWHPSKLPIYRGPTPMQTCLKDSQKVTALSWIEMTKEMDAGNILLQVDRRVGPEATILDLSQEMGDWGAKTWCLALVSQCLEDFQSKKQDLSMVTFTTMLKKEDKFINPQEMTFQQIFNHYRAYLGFPGTVFVDDFFQVELKIKEAFLGDKKGETIFESIFWVQTKNNSEYLTYLKTKDGFLNISKIILSGGKQIDFRGFRFKKVI